MTFQAAQSRAIRNVVLAGVPRWLTDQAKERAKEAVLQGISKEGLATATEKALKFLAGYGINEDRVIALLEKPKQEWASEDIATLRGMASQLKDGQATAEHLFPALEPQAPEKPKADSRGKRARPAKAEEVKLPRSSAILPPRAATVEQMAAIRLRCLEKEIGLELILQIHQVSQLEELDCDSATLVLDWLESQ